MSPVRDALSAIPLLGTATIAGVAVSRPSLTGYRVGDITHDLDNAAHILEGDMPLRGPVLGLGRWTETWIDGRGAHRRVAALRSILGSGNVSQERNDGRALFGQSTAKLCIYITPPAGRAIPPVELPAQSRRAA